MRTKMAHLISLLLLILLAGTALGGVIAPDLEKELATLRPDDTAGAVIILAEKADIPRLDADLRAAKASLATRHSTVVGELQKVAARSQADLLRHLDARKAAGETLEYQSYWIMNAVTVRGPVKLLRELADRPEVEKLIKGPDMQLIEADARPVMNSGKASREGGVTPGLKAMNVPQVWSELGVDGTGAVVGIIDTGVDGDHVAYGTRWRGNFAPPEHCWYDHSDLNSPVPYNDPAQYHGTHVLGTMVGQTATDQIGVAPGALWIATNPLEADYAEGKFLNSFQFMADPDGDPLTTDDLPVVVENSWTDGGQCTWDYAEAMDNCEAAGVALVFAAGNNGTGGPGTIVSPASRATTSTSSFAVGATVVDSPNTIAWFSSLGPSDCGGEFAMKPEVTAPGQDIYSSLPEDTFGDLSGTSMAGPHAAGVIALMRAADPNLGVVEAKEILMQTAMDRGAAGEDNTYGHGFIDAYAAVATVMGVSGEVRGIVQNSGTGRPLANATVTTSDTGVSAITDENGLFTMVLMPGSRTFDVSCYGYTGGSFSATVLDGMPTLTLWSLTPETSQILSGVVTDYLGQPVAGASVSVMGTGLQRTTGTNGSYSFNLLAGVDVSYTLEVDGGLDGLTRTSFDFPGTMSVDVRLFPRAYEDFETGDFSRWPWGPYGYELSQVDPYEGSYCLRSWPVAVETGAGLSLNQVEILEAGDLVLQYQWPLDDPNSCFVGILAAYDGGIGYRGGALHPSTDWAEFRMPLEPGLQSIIFFIYNIDSEDPVQVAFDDIVLPEAVRPYASPELQLSQSVVNMEVEIGQTLSTPLYLTNIGLLDLQWSAITSIDPVKAMAPWLTQALEYFVNEKSGAVPAEKLRAVLDRQAEKKPVVGPVLSLSPYSGLIEPGVRATLTCTANARTSPEGFFQRAIILSTNDPAQTQITVPVNITVTRPDLHSLARTTGGLAVVPNPFNPMTNLSFALARDRRVSLEIFDLKGHRVRTLENSDLPPGEYTYTWRGKDDAGSPMASGVYHARLKIGTETHVQSLTLVR